MLKKLIKYGNSQALLLNRSILGLLGIDDGDTVKLRVEGDVLLITKGVDGSTGKPEVKAALEDEIKKEEKSHKQFLEGGKLLKEVRENRQAMMENNTYDPSKPEDLHDSPKWKEHMKQMKAINEKHSINLADLSKKMMENKGYMKGLELLGQSYKEMDTDDYTQEVLNLRYKFFPELKAYDEEMQQIDSE